MKRLMNVVIAETEQKFYLSEKVGLLLIGDFSAKTVQRNIQEQEMI